jgi:hypothetical protein
MTVDSWSGDGWRTAKLSPTCGIHELVRESAKPSPAFDVPVGPGSGSPEQQSSDDIPNSASMPSTDAPTERFHDDDQSAQPGVDGGPPTPVGAARDAMTDSPGGPFNGGDVQERVDTSALDISPAQEVDGERPNGTAPPMVPGEGSGRSDAAMQAAGAAPADGEDADLNAHPTLDNPSSGLSAPASAAPATSVPAPDTTRAPASPASSASSAPSPAPTADPSKAAPTKVLKYAGPAADLTIGTWVQFDGGKAGRIFGAGHGFFAIRMPGGGSVKKRGHQLQLLSEERIPVLDKAEEAAFKKVANAHAVAAELQKAQARLKQQQQGDCAELLRRGRDAIAQQFKQVEKVAGPRGVEFLQASMIARHVPAVNSAAQLKEWFAQFGAVMGLTVICRDGFADEVDVMVTFASPQDCTNAQQQCVESIAALRARKQRPSPKAIKGGSGFADGVEAAGTANALKCVVQHMRDCSNTSRKRPAGSSVAAKEGSVKDADSTDAAKRRKGESPRATEAWTDSETARLLEAVNFFQRKQWPKIAACVGSRSEDACRHRYCNVLKADPHRVEAAGLMILCGDGQPHKSVKRAHTAEKQPAPKRIKLTCGMSSSSTTKTVPSSPSPTPADDKPTPWGPKEDALLSKIVLRRARDQLANDWKVTAKQLNDAMGTGESTAGMYCPAHDACPLVVCVSQPLAFREDDVSMPNTVAAAPASAVGAISSGQGDAPATSAAAAASPATAAAAAAAAPASGDEESAGSTAGLATAGALASHPDRLHRVLHGAPDPSEPTTGGAWGRRLRAAGPSHHGCLERRRRLDRSGSAPRSAPQPRRDTPIVTRDSIDDGVLITSLLLFQDVQDVQGVQGVQGDQEGGQGGKGEHSGDALAAHRRRCHWSAIAASERYGATVREKVT